MRLTLSTIKCSVLRTALLFCLPFFLIPQLAQAGAWNQEKGSGFTQLQFNILNYQYGAISNERTDLGLLVRDITLNYYVEYGLTNSITLIGSLPFKSVGIQDYALVIPDPGTSSPENLAGFSNIDLAAKIKIYDGGPVISAQMGVAAPATAINDEYGLRTGIDAWTFTPKILAGVGLKRGYLTAETGIQFRTNNYGHNFLFNFEGGYLKDWKHPKHKTYFSGVFSVLVQVSDGSYFDDNTATTLLYHDDAAWILPGLKINHGIGENIWLTFGAYGAALYINYGASFPSINFGVAYEW